MAGTVLENLSRKKLMAVAGILFSLQVLSFLLGGLVAPAPSTPWLMIGTTCSCKEKESDCERDWFYSRPVSSQLNSTNCPVVDITDDKITEEREITANDVVFTFQLPGPRDNMELEMDRWFQHMSGLIQFEVEINEQHPLQEDPPPKLLLEMKMGYRESATDPVWHLLGSASEERLMRCHKAQPHDFDADDDDPEALAKTKELLASEVHYECPAIPLFEFPAYYPYYLLNIRLPVDETVYNLGIGRVLDISVVTIFQNGGFSKVWLGLKTLLFLMLVPVILWFWRRIRTLTRKPTILEKTLLCLGVSLTILDGPIEWFSLSSHIPAMPLLSDLRQGLFLTVLLCFWVIFIGEHIMDGVHRDTVTAYWRQLAAVTAGCLFLLVFDMCERGVQLVNPFYSIWSTEETSRVALAFIILASVSAAVYLIYLLYMVVQVFRRINIKKRNLPSMSARARKIYQSIIFRFKFMMVLTVFCLVLTIIFFLLSDIAETSWKFNDDSEDMPSAPLQINSAFFTGVYCMWNLYVILLMSMYAPSFKPTSTTTAYTDDSTGGEEVEFTQLTSTAHVTPTAAAAASAAAATEELTALTASTSASAAATQPSEMQSLTAFVSKAAQD